MTSVTVLCPNAHRVVVKTTPNTSILQILENACSKHKYNADNYTLRHLKRLLDVTATIRFSAIPNRCVLEMVELTKPRTAQPVTVCLIDEQGNKCIKKYLPSVNLWSVLEESKLIGSEKLNDSSLLHSIVFSMNKVSGREDLTNTTLKMLGLTSGSGSMRYSCHAQQQSQSQISCGTASSSSQYTSASNVTATIKEIPKDVSNENRRSSDMDMDQVDPPPAAINRQPDVGLPDSAPIAINPAIDANSNVSGEEFSSPDIVTSSLPIPDVVMKSDEKDKVPDVLSGESSAAPIEDIPPPPAPIVAFSGTSHSLSHSSNEVDTLSTVNVNTECESMAVDAPENSNKLLSTPHQCVIFHTSDMVSATPQFQQESDDFFEHSTDDVRKIQRERTQEVDKLSNAPLLTAAQREAEKSFKLLTVLNQFPVTQLRIHFPGDLIAQASFKPTDTVQTVASFVTTLLENEAMQFELLAGYPRAPLSRQATLNEANLVPKARVYFSALTEHIGGLLKQSVLSSVSSYQVAKDALVKEKKSGSTFGLGAPSSAPSTSQAPPSLSYQQSVKPKVYSDNSQKPKWLKFGKK